MTPSTRLLATLAVACAATGAAAPATAAQDLEPVAPAAPPRSACPPGTTAARGLVALRRVVVRAPLPGRAGDAVPVIVLPCERGRLTLEVRLRGTSVVIARGVRDVRPGRARRVLLRTTRAGERRAGRRLRLRLRTGFVARA